MKIALMGYGAWGRHHAEAIAETPGFELAGVCAASEASRRAARERFPGALVTGDYRELLDGAEAVDIVLPTDLHCEAAEAALAAGLHVLLEKPMALTPAECGRIMDAARRSGKRLYVGHEFRLSTQWGRMRALIAEGTIGRPLFCTIDLYRFPYRLGAERWRWSAPRVGSWILEEPIHFFDLACWWMGDEPVSVYARGTRLPTTPEGLWDNVTAVVGFAGGTHATVTQTLAAAEHHLAAKVVGETGALLAFWDGEMDRTTRPRAALKVCRGGAVEDLPMAASGEFFELRAEIARFREICGGQSVPPVTIEEAARAVSICQAAEISIQKGDIIRLRTD